MNQYLRFLKIGALALVVACGTFACQRGTQNVEANNTPPATATSVGEQDSLSASDRDFLNDAQTADAQEVDLGQLALQKSQNSSVRNYAQMLIDDHTKDAKSVTGIMNKVMSPQDMSQAHVNDDEISRMEALSGPEFDNEFASAMVQDHQQDLQKYQNEANSTMNKDARNYASNDISVLQKHLSKAQDLQTKLGNGQNK